MTNQVKKFDRHIESVLATLDVLDCFLDNPRMTIKDFVEATGLTRNRVSRILGTLLHKGYVMETAERGMFTAGPKLLSLGNVFKINQNLVALVRPILKELALKTGESATFSIREGRERVVLAREEGTSAIRFSVSVGQRMDLLAGVAGKVLLAHTSYSERDIILAGARSSEVNPESNKNPLILLEELEQIGRIGFAVSKGERDPDAFSIAAPVFERKKQLVGAVATAGPISRLTAERERSYLGDLLRAAGQLSGSFSKAQ